MFDHSSEYAMMELVRVILFLELALAGIALVIVVIRAFGPAFLRDGLIRSIIAVKHTIHLG
jgi:hypothetical protein